MTKYSIKEIKESVKVIEKLSGDCLLKNASDKEMMRAILYNINQHAHNMLHNIDHYGLR